jgi:hypothetical protein
MKILKIIFTVVAVIHAVLAVVALVLSVLATPLMLLGAASSVFSMLVMIALVLLLDHAQRARLSVGTAPRHITPDSIGYPELPTPADRAVAARVHLPDLLEMSLLGHHALVVERVNALTSEQEEWLAQRLAPLEHLYPKLCRLLAEGAVERRRRHVNEEPEPVASDRKIRRLIDCALAHREDELRDILDSMPRADLPRLQRLLDEGRYTVPPALKEAIEARLAAPAEPVDEDEMIRAAGSAPLADKVRQLLAQSQAENYDVTWSIIAGFNHPQLAWLEHRLGQLGPTHRTLRDQVRRRLGKAGA